MGHQRKRPPATAGGEEELGVWLGLPQPSPSPAPQVKFQAKRGRGRKFGGRDVEGPAEPYNRVFLGLLGAEVGRDFPGRAWGRWLVPFEELGFRERDLGSL